MTTKQVYITETDHAFRINGVTVAKRHLAKVLGRASPDIEKVLLKYLVIVPHLANEFKLEDQKVSQSVRYGVIKAKRLYKALELDDDSEVAFMTTAARLADPSFCVALPGKMYLPQSATL